MLSPATVRAATRQVVAGGTNSGDCISVACGSIAYAIAQAAAGDGISVGAGTFNEHDLALTKNLTITGAGAGMTMIDAQLSGRGFYVNVGVTAAISNLTVQRGYPGAGNNGGGINNLGTLTLTGVIVTNSGVHDYTSPTYPYPYRLSYGAGMANSGALTLVNVTVSNNTAAIEGLGDYGINIGGGQGAGVYNTGTLNVQGSTFSGNVAGPLTNGREYGGAIFNRFSGRITMSYSTITNNIAQSGSAILACGDSCSSSSTTGPIVLDHVTANNNQDGEFGAINVAANLTLTNCTVTNNVGGGGGINASNGTFTMSDSIVSNNTSGYENAAGINVSGGGGSAIARSVISGNTNTNTGTGGLAFNSGSLTLTDTQITGNSGITGGARLTPQGPLTISNTTISSNTGTVFQNQLGAAGLLYYNGGANAATQPMVMTNSTVRDNVGGSTSTAGGIDAGNYVQITGSTISGNSGDGFVTSVLVAPSNPPPAGTVSVITNSTVSGNTGRGVVEANDQLHTSGYSYAPLILTNDTILNNGGGGVALTTNGSITLKNTLLKNTNYNCSGPLTTGGYNLDSGTACFLAGGTDLRGVDPKISPLGSNGGPTLTHALQIGSPAIDAIPAIGGCNGAGLTTDQRGAARPSGAGCEIGAVEFTVNTQPTGHAPAPTVGAPAAQPPLTGSHPAKPTVPAPPMAQPARH